MKRYHSLSLSILSRHMMAAHFLLYSTFRARVVHHFLHPTLVGQTEHRSSMNAQFASVNDERSGTRLDCCLSLDIQISYEHTIYAVLKHPPLPQVVQCYAVSRVAYRARAFAAFCECPCPFIFSCMRRAAATPAIITGVNAVVVAIE